MRIGFYMQGGVLQHVAGDDAIDRLKAIAKIVPVIVMTVESTDPAIGVPEIQKLIE